MHFGFDESLYEMLEWGAMTMTSRLRKFVLTTHIISSVGWLGAVASFLALAIVGLTSKHDQTIRSAYIAMELTTWVVIVPSAVVCLISGVSQSLATSWGLFRHYWIVAKFIITIIATGLLLVHTRPIGILARAASDVAISIATYHSLQVQLVVDAAAAIILLLAATILSVYKPWGLTAYGRRKNGQRQTLQVDGSLKPDYEAEIKLDREGTIRRPRWVYVVGIHAIGLVVLFIVLHLTGRGFGH